MDYPYLVDTLKSNLKLLKDLQVSTEQLIMHSVKNAPTQKGRFVTQPVKKLMTPLPKGTTLDGGRKTKIKRKAKSKTQKNKNKNKNKKKILKSIKK